MSNEYHTFMEVNMVKLFCFRFVTSILSFMFLDVIENITINSFLYLIKYRRAITAEVKTNNLHNVADDFYVLKYQKNKKKTTNTLEIFNYFFSLICTANRKF